MPSEYSIPCTVDRLPHVAARWPLTPAGRELYLPTTGVLQAIDHQHREVLIFESEWVLRLHHRKKPAHRIPRVDVTLTRMAGVSRNVS